jgi:hypothetical protein
MKLKESVQDVLGKEVKLDNQSGTGTVPSTPEGIELELTRLRFMNAEKDRRIAYLLTKIDDLTGGKYVHKD